MPETLKTDAKSRKYCSRQNKITVHDAQNIGRKSKYKILYECVSEGSVPLGLWLFFGGGGI